MEEGLDEPLVSAGLHRQLEALGPELKASTAKVDDADLRGTPTEGVGTAVAQAGAKAMAPRGGRGSRRATQARYRSLACRSSQIPRIN